VACPKRFNICETFVKRMLWDHKSPDIDGIVWTDGSYLSLPCLWTRSSPPKSTDVIYSWFLTSGFWNLKPFFLSYFNLLEMTICRHISFSINSHAPTLGVWPFKSNQWSCDPILNQWSRSPSGLRNSEISDLKLLPFSQWILSKGYNPLTHFLLIWKLRITSGLYP